MKNIDSLKVAECIRLRKEERLSIKEIVARAGISKGSVSNILRNIRLSKDEVLEREIESGKTFGGRSKKDRGVESKNYRFTVGMTKEQHGRLSEAAICFRLCLHKLSWYVSMFDGDKIDFVVDTGKKFVKLQVRSVKKNEYGLPYVSLRCSDGRSGQRRYSNSEFDFLVGYDNYTDLAYLWSKDEIEHLKTGVTINKESEERWDKIVG